MQHSTEAVGPTVLHYIEYLSLAVSIFGDSIFLHPVGSGDTTVE